MADVRTELDETARAEREQAEAHRQASDAGDSFPDRTTEEGHQHDRADHNVVGVYGGGGYHRATHGADADATTLPGMRGYDPDAEAPSGRRYDPEMELAKREAGAEPVG